MDDVAEFLEGNDLKFITCGSTRSERYSGLINVIVEVSAWDEAYTVDVDIYESLGITSTEGVDCLTFSSSEGLGGGVGRSSNTCVVDFSNAVFNLVLF